MSRKWLLVFCLLLVDIPQALADVPARDSIDFGGVRLTLGMPQDRVVNLIRARYRVEPAPNFPRQRTGLWWVYDERNEKYGTIGSLYFPEGTLTEARLEWTPEKPAAKPAVNTLRAVFDAMSLSAPDFHQRRCMIGLDRPSQRPSEVTGMVITCGTRIVNINIVSHEGEDDAVYIEEVLAAPLPGGRTSQADR